MHTVTGHDTGLNLFLIHLRHKIYMFLLKLFSRFPLPIVCCCFMAHCAPCRKQLVSTASWRFFELEGEKEDVQPESSQTFEVATTQTSGLLSLVLCCVVKLFYFRVEASVY